MSHISTYEADIALPIEEGEELEDSLGFQLLRQAMEVMAEEHNGFLSKEITDYFGEKSRVDLALITKKFPVGLGVNVDRKTGTLKFLYDDYGYDAKLIEELKNQIKQNYTSLAVAQALKDLNYRVELEENNAEKKVVIRGYI